MMFSELLTDIEKSVQVTDQFNDNNLCRQSRKSWMWNRSAWHWRMKNTSSWQVGCRRSGKLLKLVVR